MYSVFLNFSLQHCYDKNTTVSDINLRPTTGHLVYQYLVFTVICCRSQGLFVKRDDVMNVLRLADPAGIVERTLKFKNKRPKKVFFSKGPNYLWSLDGRDKLSGAANCQFDLKIYGYVTCSDFWQYLRIGYRDRKCGTA